MSNKKNENLELLLEAGRLLSSKLELGSLLQTVLALATRIVDAERASLLLFDERRQELYFDIALGLDEKTSKIRLKLGQGIAGTVAKTRQPEIIADARADPRWSAVLDEAFGFQTRSLLAVPMLLKGRLIGVIEVVNKREGDFTAADQLAFETFASQAGIAIENARLFSALNEERFKLSAVFSQMTDCAILTDSAGTVLLSNEAANRLLGAKPSNIHASFKSMAVTPSLDSLLNGTRPIADFAAVRRKPTLLVFQGHATRAPLSRGEAHLFIFHDHTEEWRQERLKRTFLSFISHKLRTPLATVAGFADILNDEMNAVKSPTAAKAVQAIRTQSAKLSDLVEKLLSYTTIESPETQIQSAPVSLDEAVQEAHHALREKIDARRAKIDVSSLGMIVMGDAAMIVDALKNLIDNAIKFNPKPEPLVAIRAQSQGDWIAVSVADNGPGIPPEDLERVFSRFHQVESDFTGQQEGLGLGLAFVRKVAELHRGHATLSSTLGSGTTVTMTLPRRKQL